MTEPHDQTGAPWELPQLGTPPTAEIAAFAGPDRIALALATRRVIDAVLTAETATDDELARAAAQVDAAASMLGRSADDPTGTRNRFERAYSDYVPRSPVIGTVHPIAPPLTYRWDAAQQTLHAMGTLPAAYEGPPGYVHGGMLAMLFDEVIGMGNIVAGHPGMTASLTVDYRRPTPLYVPLRFEARVDRIDGNAIHASGTCHANDVLTARATGRFVIVSEQRAEEYFGTQHAPFKRDGDAEPTP